MVAVPVIFSKGPFYFQEISDQQTTDEFITDFPPRQLPVKLTDKVNFRIGTPKKIPNTQQTGKQFTCLLSACSFTLHLKVLQ